MRCGCPVFCPLSNSLNLVESVIAIDCFAYYSHSLFESFLFVWIFYGAEEVEVVKYKKKDCEMSQKLYKYFLEV